MKKGDKVKYQGASCEVVGVAKDKRGEAVDLKHADGHTTYNVPAGDLDGSAKSGK